MEILYLQLQVELILLEMDLLEDRVDQAILGDQAAQEILEDRVVLEDRVALVVLEVQAGGYGDNLWEPSPAEVLHWLQLAVLEDRWEREGLEIQ